MIANLLYAIGAICLILGICALVGLLHLPATMLLIIAVVCLVVGYFLSRRPTAL